MRRLSLVRLQSECTVERQARTTLQSLQVEPYHKSTFISTLRLVTLGRMTWNADGSETEAEHAIATLIDIKYRTGDGNEREVARVIATSIDIKCMIDLALNANENGNETEAEPAIATLTEMKHAAKNEEGIEVARVIAISTDITRMIDLVMNANGIESETEAELVTATLSDILDMSDLAVDNGVTAERIIHGHAMRSLHQGLRDSPTDIMRGSPHIQCRGLHPGVPTATRAAIWTTCHPVLLMAVTAYSKNPCVVATAVLSRIRLSIDAQSMMQSMTIPGIPKTPFDIAAQVLSSTT